MRFTIEQYQPDDLRELAVLVDSSAESRGLFVGFYMAFAGSMFLGLLVNSSWLVSAVVLIWLMAMAWIPRLSKIRRLAILERTWSDYNRALVIEVIDHGVVIATQHERTTFRWSAFSRRLSGESAGLFVLFGNERVVVVPKRAIGDQQTVDLFRQIVRREMRAE